jgi:tyrosine-protein kinase Etk/Wzc
MDNQFNQMISLTDILMVLKRRKWWLVLFLTLTLVSAVVYNYKAVPIYSAATKLIFEDTDKVTEFNPLGVAAKGNLIANQIEEMKTKSFARDVTKQIPADQKEIFRSFSTYKPEYNFEEFIVYTIQSNFSFTPIRGTEIITVEFMSEDPELAAFIVNTTSEVLIQRNLVIRRQQYSNVTSFIEERFDIVSARLNQSEEALKDYKENQNITSLEAESQEILVRITNAEVVYNDVQTTKKELQERLNAIETKLAAEQKDLTQNVLKTNSPLAIQLKERLVTLEVTFSNFQVQGYPEDNPKMVDLKNEIAQVKQNLIDETVKINTDENIGSLIDPFSQIAKFLEDKINLEVELQALEAKERNLNKLLSRYDAKLSNLPDKEMKLVRLLRDKEVNNKLYMTLLEERERSKIKEASEITNIRVLEPARVPAGAIRPRKTLNLIAAVFAGLSLGIFVAFVLEYFNDTIKNQEDLEKQLQIPVTAVIPKVKTNLNKILETSKNGDFDLIDDNKSMLFEAYSLLSFALDQKKQTESTIMVTSAIPNEGKSTLASMLAVTSAQRGKRTLLIDTDLRKPSLHTMFSVPREPGISNLTLEFMQRLGRDDSNGDNDSFVEMMSSVQEYQEHIKVMNAQMVRTALLEGIVQTFESNLFFLPAGFIPSNPVRLWSSPVWHEIMPQLKEIAEVIIFDAPPIIGVAETTMMTNYIDHVLFCVSVGGLDTRTLRRCFRSFKDSIKEPDKKILGAVLNKAEMEAIYGSYKYYSYYTKSRQSRRKPEIPKSDFITKESSKS